MNSTKILNGEYKTSSNTSNKTILEEVQKLESEGKVKEAKELRKSLNKING